jgi:hypothetical protein
MFCDNIDSHSVDALIAPRGQGLCGPEKQ